MANSRKMLEEAIAEAKSVKAMAIASAKSSLEEAFTPHLTSMLSAKIQEMEEEDEEEDENEEETLDLENMTDDDLKKYIEDVIGDMVEKGELEAGEGAGEEEEEEMEMEDETEMELEESEDEVDLEELLAEMDFYDADEMEDADFFNDDDSDELENLGVNFDDSVMDDEFEDESLDEEIDLDELLAEIDLEEDEEELEEGVFDIFKSSETKFLEKNKSKIDQIKSLPEEERVAAINQLVQSFRAERSAEGISPAQIRADATSLFQKLGLAAGGGFAQQSESVALQEMKKEIETLKKDLKEINVFNSKLLYTNKIFKEKNLNESQKIQVLKSFDKAKTAQESKLIYETIKSSVIPKTATPIRENKGSASKTIVIPNKPKQIINENDQFARMQQLAFGENKY
jgi:hypothetical protein